MSSPFKSVVPRFPMEFATAMRDICHLSNFVETGTYHGDTALRAAPHFKQVVTIEGVSDRYKIACMRERPSNVTMTYGPSEYELQRVMDTINGPAFVFLDAHWIHAGSTIENDSYQGSLRPCPLMRELDAIDMEQPHVIAIDDAHFFMHPPRHRGIVDYWPSLDQICQAIKNRYVFINEGMIVAVPEMYRSEVQEWLLDNWRGWDRFVDNRATNGGNVAQMKGYSHA